MTSVLEELSPGDGTTFPKVGDKILVHYTGCIAATGTPFDSSRARGHAFTTIIGCGKVIPGWDSALLSLSKGQRVKLHIPSAEGYGDKGNPPTIAPNTDLLFDIELLAINETLVQESIRVRRETAEREENARQDAAKRRHEQEMALELARGGARGSGGSEKRRRDEGSVSDSSSSSYSSSESSERRKRRKKEKKARKKKKKEKKARKKRDKKEKKARKE